MVEKEAGVSVKRGGFLNKRGKKLKQREREENFWDFWAYFSQRGGGLFIDG